MNARTAPPTWPLAVATAYATVLLAGCLGPAGPVGPVGPASPAPGPGAADAPGLAVTDVQVGPVNATAALVRFAVAGPDNATAWVEYDGTTPGAADAAGLDHRSDMVHGPGPHIVHLEGLRGNATYRVRVAAQSDAESVTGPVQVVSTPPVRHLWAAPDDARIYPGIVVGDQNTTCTLAFVLTTQWNASVYAVTAGHCVDHVGQTVGRRAYDGGGFLGGGLNVTWFGDVVAFESPNRASDPDWALVRVWPQHRGNVSPQVLWWGGPTGVVSAASMLRGDVDQACVATENANKAVLTGGGLDDYNHRTILERVAGRETVWCAEFRSYNESTGRFTWDWLFAEAGDSGSPVVDPATGATIGILTAITYPHVSATVLGDDEPIEVYRHGTTVADTLVDTLKRLEARGWDLSLATAPYDPPT